MKRNIFLIVIFLIFLIYTIDNFFTKSMIVGTYVSNNKTSIIDGPSNGDTLVLLDNNTFKSQTWGNGKYSLEYSGKGTKINIHYKYEFGTAGYQMGIQRSFYIKPKIIIDRDLNYYFEKFK